LQDAARRHGFDLLVLGVNKREEVLPALETAKASGAQALNLLATPLFNVEPQPFFDKIAACSGDASVARVGGRRWLAWLWTELHAIVSAAR
jgi:hypothetical protein